MDIIRKQGVWRLFDRTVALLVTDERQFDIILDDPARSLFSYDDRGFSGERETLYRHDLSLVDLCREGRENGAERIEVSYDFFFGGRVRTLYPDSEKTIRAFKAIHDVAAAHGLSFSASIVSPLDVGGGYAQNYSETGFTYSYREGLLRTDGSYSVEMAFEKQWTNNKGPAELKLEHVLVYAFDERRIGGTPYFAVAPERIRDISATARYELDETSVTITSSGYGSGRMRVFGQWEAADREVSLDRVLAVAVYRTPELDYFHPDAGRYMKEVIDRHHQAGITYQGFYSDEMHIQFDWDLRAHFGHEEIATRYLTPHLANAFADRYGEQFRDFARYLVYFSYHQHDFLEGPAGELASQHVFGPSEQEIQETWLFRKRYFELLQARVVGLCVEARDYAESLFGAPIMTRAHATWQEAPTCDRFFDAHRFSEPASAERSRYEYTPHYVWSSSIRENISACYDYFRWNEFLSGGGTDHPEGGFTDRNYYAQAFACSLGVLNRFPYAYCGTWGSPEEVLRRLRDVGAAYGTTDWDARMGHNLVQNLSLRETDVLALYPLELNYAEERFGSWMVQYGYCNYITEEQLLRHASVTKDGKLAVKGRRYRTLLVLFEPFVAEATLDLLERFVEAGGIAVWTATPALLTEEGGTVADRFGRLFGIDSLRSPTGGVSLQDRCVTFDGLLAGIKPMPVLTDMLPDRGYPVEPSAIQGVRVVARCDGLILGTARTVGENGLALYLGFRPRDDQSRSTGGDVDTLFSILRASGAYDPRGGEVRSRPADSRYLFQRFPNGAISVANHYRTFYEDWDGRFFRDEERDRAALAGRELTPVGISFAGEEVLGHRVVFDGTDVLTFRLDADGRLDGFAGTATTGITVNGRAYRLCETPSDVVLAHIAPEHRAPDLRDLYMVRVDAPQTLRLPIPTMDGEEFEAAVCETSVFQADRPTHVRREGETLLLTVTEREAGRWIALYRR